jgi:hypothetical protein
MELSRSLGMKGTAPLWLQLLGLCPDRRQGRSLYLWDGIKTLNLTLDWLQIET